ncbi:DUF6153 family protein [Streptomyces sp. NPDC020965]|uniref:DUF6153 family protein n=1 Tax=Streptomyces sp. NPDC020965 TaxID=3365105 RepID=UPI00379931FF
MDQRSRAVSIWGQLLLVVLALGVFAMHTTGHQDHGSATTTRPATATAASAPVTTVGPTVPAPETRDGADDGGAAHGTGLAMDLASLCVAVLAGWVLLALPGTALGRRTGRPGSPRAAAPPRLRTRPPPRAPDLAELSILRI